MNIRPEDVSSRLVIVLCRNPDIIRIVSSDTNFRDNSQSSERMMNTIQNLLPVQSVARYNNSLTITVSSHLFPREYIPQIIDAVLEHGMNAHAGPDDIETTYKPTLFLDNQSLRQNVDLGLSNVHPWTD